MLYFRSADNKNESNAISYIDFHMNKKTILEIMEKNKMKPLCISDKGLNQKKWTVMVLIVCGLTAIVLLSGCANVFRGKSSQEEIVPSVKEKTTRTTAVHFDFEDILVPRELKIVNDKSFVVSTPGYRSGVLTLKGMVEPSSLFQFFSTNMKKDNWQVVSQIKSPGIIIMVFQKASKCAVITIRDDFTTNVEIGVAPTLDTGVFSNQSSSNFMESDLSQ